MAYLSKSNYVLGLKCPKLQWMIFNDKDSIPGPNRGAQYRFNLGNIVGELAKKNYPGGIDIPTEDFCGNIRLTRSYLGDDRPLFEAGIVKNNLYSRLDILKPNNDGTFDIIEVKSSTKVKEVNIQDVSFQKHCCERAGLNINRCYLMFINNQYVRQGEINFQELFTRQDITAEVNEAMEGIDERIRDMFKIIGSADSPEVPVGNQCNDPYGCDLEDECWDFLPERNIFTLYRGGKKSTELFENGIYHIRDIPEGFELREKQQIQRSCELTGDIHIQKQDIQDFLNGLQYPLYYLDFETFSPPVPRYDNTRPYQLIPFQFSLHIVQEDGTTEHISFLAEWTGDPRPAFLEQLDSALGSSGSIVVYNESFEKRVLKELAGDFPEYESRVNEFLPRLVDLLKPFRNFHYYNPEQKGSASIKCVLPAITGMGMMA